MSFRVHFGTFALGDDGEFEAVHELREALNNKDEINGALLHGPANPSE